MLCLDGEDGNESEECEDGGDGTTSDMDDSSVDTGEVRKHVARVDGGRTFLTRLVSVPEETGRQQDGDGGRTTFTVICGAVTATLHKKRFASGWV